MKQLNILYNTLKDTSVIGLESIYYCIYILFSLFKKTNNILNINNDILSKLNNIIQSLNTNDVLLDSIVNDVFSFHLDNDNINIIKDYSKFYNNKLLTNYIVNMINTYDNMIILDCNVKVNSFIEAIASKTNININNIYGVQTNKMIKDISTLNINIKTNQDISKNISCNDILSEDVPFPTKFFDIIFCDFPSGIHNIIHASCCNKIKKLKLRGTKSEALLLQLIMMSLNKNGTAILIVPDMLLFSDSVQMVETRKFLLEKFNVIKIVELHETIQYNKGVKNSILYFENNKPQNNVTFSKLNSNMVEEHIFDMSLNMIQTNTYSLWYKHYVDMNKLNNVAKVEHVIISNVFDIMETVPTINDSKLLGLNKYYIDNQSIKVIDNSISTENITYFLKPKVNNDFICYYLEYIINTFYQQFTKGKMHQFDLNKIKSYSLPVVPKDKQFAITNYLSTTNNIIKDHMKNIDHYILLKKYLMETIPLNNMITLDKIVNIHNEVNLSNDMVGVIRNSISAGSVYIVKKNTELNTNSHYININNNDYNIEYVYHWLKYNEDKLKEISNLTIQPNLNKSNLLAFKIPIIDIVNQNNIISYCNDIDNNINKHNLALDNIKSKNIFSILCKLLI
jgi:hypothetical protein